MVNFHFSRSFAIGRRGSASVLVIMLAITLLVFGVFSMMSAYSGLALARRNASWTQAYYALESEASEIVSELVPLLPEWIDDAEGNMSAVVTNLLQYGGEARDEEIEDQWHRILEDRIAEGLAESGFPAELDRTGTAKKPGIHLITLTLNAQQGDGLHGFSAVLQLTMPPYAGTESHSPFIELLSWRSVAEEFEYVEGVEFRDVEVTHPVN